MSIISFFMLLYKLFIEYLYFRRSCMKSNIVLVGMPGSGKSTIGRLLSNRLAMPLIDTDLLIKKKVNKGLQDVINKDGIDTFLKIEEETILELCVSNSIISTGGSVIYSEKSMMHLKETGLVIFLDVTYADMRKRIRNAINRGIVIRKGQSFFDMYNERMPLYNKYSDIAVKCSGKSSKEIADIITGIYKKHASKVED